LSYCDENKEVFDDYLVLSWRFEQKILKNASDSSGKFEPKINRCSSLLLLLHWFKTCFDSSSSLLQSSSCDRLELELQEDKKNIV
jgi:hypothetical protein